MSSSLECMQSWAGICFTADISLHLLSSHSQNTASTAPHAAAHPFSVLHWLHALSVLTCLRCHISLLANTFVNTEHIPRIHERVQTTKPDRSTATTKVKVCLCVNAKAVGMRLRNAGVVSQAACDMASNYSTSISELGFC